MVTTANIALIIFLILGMVARSNLLAAAETILLTLRITNLTFWLQILSLHGVGLLFLTLAMLVPFALGTLRLKDIRQSFLTLPGSSKVLNLYFQMKAALSLIVLSHFRI